MIKADLAERQNKIARDHYHGIIITIIIDIVVVCLFVYIPEGPIQLFVYFLFIYLFKFLFMYLFIYSFIYVFMYLCIYVFMYLFLNK